MLIFARGASHQRLPCHKQHNATNRNKEQKIKLEPEFRDSVTHAAWCEVGRATCSSIDAAHSDSNRRSVRHVLAA